MSSCFKQCSSCNIHKPLHHFGYDIKHTLCEECRELDMKYSAEHLRLILKYVHFEDGTEQEATRAALLAYLAHRDLTYDLVLLAEQLIEKSITKEEIAEALDEAERWLERCNSLEEKAINQKINRLIEGRLGDESRYSLLSYLGLTKKGEQSNADIYARMNLSHLSHTDASHEAFLIWESLVLKGEIELAF